MNSDDRSRKAWNAGSRGESQPKYGDSDYKSRARQDYEYKKGVEHREGMKKAWWWLEPRKIDYTRKREPRKRLNMAFDETKEYTPLEKELSLDLFLTIVIVLFNIYVLAMGTDIQKTICITLSVIALAAIYIFIAKGYKK